MNVSRTKRRKFESIEETEGSTSEGIVKRSLGNFDCYSSLFHHLCMEFIYSYTVPLLKQENQFSTKGVPSVIMFLSFIYIYSSLEQFHLLNLSLYSLHCHL